MAQVENILQQLNRLKMKAVQANLFAIATILRDTELKIKKYEKFCEKCAPPADSNWYGLRAFIIWADDPS